jgi:hypothetical protein
MKGGLPSLPACTPTHSIKPLCHMQGLPTVQRTRITKCWCYGAAISEPKQVQCCRSRWLGSLLMLLLCAVASAAGRGGQSELVR